jgi:hypothetical protein
MRAFVAPFVIGIVALLAPAAAHAHFTLDQLDNTKPVSWMSQDASGGPQKTGPCAAMPGNGDSMGTPTHIVTGLTAGETVKITVTATVPHPGWYRVALMEGPAASQTLTTLPDPMAMAGTNCTPAIMTNPVWSKTQPVIADGLPMGSTAKTMQTGTKVLTATIPENANCTTASPCTIQVIMVMTDHPANDCYYHHCADITTSGSGSPDAGTGDGGMSMGGGTAAGGAAGGTKGAGGSVGTGGVTASGGASGTGGGTASGGSTATGGATETGGKTGSGGSTATGGSSAVASGGASASGGKTGSGGNVASTGGTTTSSSGGSSGSGASSNGGGGCTAIPDAGSAPFLAAGAALLALLIARRHRKS